MTRAGAIAELAGVRQRQRAEATDQPGQPADVAVLALGIDQGRPQQGPDDAGRLAGGDHGVLRPGQGGGRARSPVGRAALVKRLVEDMAQAKACMPPAISRGMSGRSGNRSQGDDGRGVGQVGAWRPGRPRSRSLPAAPSAGGRRLTARARAPRRGTTKCRPGWSRPEPAPCRRFRPCVLWWRATPAPPGARLAQEEKRPRTSVKAAGVEIRPSVSAPGSWTGPPCETMVAEAIRIGYRHRHRRHLWQRGRGRARIKARRPAAPGGGCSSPPAGLARRYCAARLLKCGRGQLKPRPGSGRPAAALAPTRRFRWRPRSTPWPRPSGAA